MGVSMAMAIFRMNQACELRSHFHA
jgi:hypothetical protein